MENTFEALLKTPIEDIVPKGQTMVVISADSSVRDALKVLVKHNIYSAPVYDDKEKKYYGFLDLVDIVTAIVGSVEHLIDSHRNLEQLLTEDTEIEHKASELAARNPLHLIGKRDTLKNALDLFASTGARRICIVENPKQEDVSHATILNVLTQSAVLAFFSKNLSNLGSVGKLKISECGLGIKKVLSVDLGAPAMDAFKMMAANRITGVAIVQEDGTLFTIISAKDIKEVDLTPPFKMLFVSAAQFVSAVRARQLKEFVPAVYVRPEHTVSEVIHKLAFLKLHRLFVVDDKKFPIGVCSQSTVLNFLAQQHVRTYVEDLSNSNSTNIRLYRSLIT